MTHMSFLTQSLPDLGVTGHLSDRVVYVHCILDHSTKLKHFDLLGHTRNGKEVTITVKLNTGMENICICIRVIKIL